LFEGFTTTADFEGEVGLALLGRIEQANAKQIQKTTYRPNS
jgi:hypothetical protein